MAVARKSDVSATGGRLPTEVTSRKKRRPAQQKKASAKPEKAPEAKQLKTSKVDLPAVSTPVSTKKQRASSKKSSPSLQELAREASSAKKQTTTSLSDPSKQKASTVPVMPSAETVPSWLLRFYTLHRYSSIMAFALVSVTLVVYGWTVYSQQLWSQAYRKMQNLQRHERQLMTTNEVLKNKMAQEAERPPAKLVSPSPDKMIFLNPAPVESNSVATTAPNSQIQQHTPNPLGY